MKKILLVEDNPGDADLARLAFETAAIDCEIRVAASGEKALAIAGECANSPQAWTPDLVLLDLKLPTMTGHEVLKRLKEDETLRRIPVIALSSSAAAEDIELSYDLSVNGYVQKPIDMPGFIAVAQSIGVFWLTMAKLPGLAR
jgi:two-component system, chemotaxis family, response regulator Rcp1